MKLIMSQTYEIITPESAENGDCAERGFEFERESFTLTETVSMLRDCGYCNPSNWPGVPRWVTTDGQMGYATGATTMRSLHPDLTDRATARLWPIALRLAARMR